MKHNGRIAEAVAAQINAADPAQTTFVSANAGSGKTTILTSRICRLLYQGARPERILCVTFTKAAAGEVQNRILSRLGEWVMMPDEDLKDQLERIGETRADITAPRLAEARRLFAKALEVPGGLKVQTIHAFAASILRRFPVEAGITPAFREIDTLEQLEIARAAIAVIAAENTDLYRQFVLAFGMNDGFLRELIDHVTLYEEGAAPVEPATANDIAHALGGGLRDDIEILEDWMSMPGLRNALEYFRGKAPWGDIEAALAAYDRGVRDPAMIDTLFGKILTQKGTVNNYVRKASEKTESYSGDLARLIEKTVSLNEARLIGNFARANAQLDEFALCFAKQYTHEKARRGVLDYDDLITKASQLLNQSGAVNWVSFKLDGAIDHILVDEAQDTNNHQWSIINALAREFFAGIGRAVQDDGPPRGIFVVGDEKQSIYSFNGADPKVFGDMRTRYRANLEDADRALNVTNLLVSFRSSPLILRAVDAVFPEERATGSFGAKAAHLARDETLPGRIDIWPPFEKSKRQTAVTWPIPEPAQSDSAAITLAYDLAKHIRQLIADGTPISVSENRAEITRPVRAGDFLVLVRKRSDFSRFILKALRDEGVPIAGVDRLVLNADLAAQDILAGLRFLAAPFDDMALATFLRSPIGGFSEDDLYELARSRMGILHNDPYDEAKPTHTLWEALVKHPEHGELVGNLKFLRDKVDFERPHELISLLIARFDAEVKLRARLGAAAKDAIEAVLDAAIDYETGQAPSLTGFVHWFEAQDIEVRRSLDAGLDAVRVMTVHGAKGLEAPIVVLPLLSESLNNSDSLTVIGDRPRFTSEGKLGMLPPAAITDRKNALKEEASKEEDRLLYVAMTRAERWLIVCGLSEEKKGQIVPDPNYTSLCQAIEGLGIDPVDIDTPQAKIKSYRDQWPDMADHPHMAAQNDAPPVFRFTKPATDHSRHTAWAPHEFGKTMADQITIAPDLAEFAARGAHGTAFGDLVHSLIEHGARLPIDDEAVLNMARSFGIHTQGIALEAKKEADNTSALLNRAGDAKIMYEVGFSFIHPKHGRFAGRIDRLEIVDKHVTVIDFKSDARIPAAPENVPAGYQLQLAIYTAAAATLFPDAEIEAKLVYTAAPRIYAFASGDLMDKLENIVSKSHDLPLAEPDADT